MIMGLSPLLDIPGAKEAPSGAALAGPSYQFHIAETATLTSLGEDFLPWFKRGNANATAPISAGPGNEFLLTHFSGRTGNKAYVMFPSTLTDNQKVKLRIGDETRVMPSIDGSEGVLLLVVPTGSPVTLVITDAGRDQSIDLRSGKPGDTSSGSAASVAKGDASWDVYGQFPGDRLASSVNVKASADLNPYAGTWAKPGKIWLNVDLELSYRSWEKLDGELNAAKSIQVKVGGRTVTVDADATGFTLLSSGIPNLYQNHLYAKVQLPKGSVHKVSVRFSPVGHLTLDGKTTQFGASSVPVKTITLK
jgi:hypothetical protein